MFCWQVAQTVVAANLPEIVELLHCSYYSFSREYRREKPVNGYVITN